MMEGSVWVLQAASHKADRIGNIKIWSLDHPPSTQGLLDQLIEWGWCPDHAGQAVTVLAQFGALEDKDRTFATFGIVDVSRGAT